MTLRTGAGPRKAAEHLLGLLVLAAGGTVLLDARRAANVLGDPAEERQS